MGQDGELLILYQEGREYWKRNPFKRKVLQNLNVGKEKTVYARFSIVPNVKGQKVNLFLQMMKNVLEINTHLNNP